MLLTNNNIFKIIKYNNNTFTSSYNFKAGFKSSTKDGCSICFLHKAHSRYPKVIREPEYLLLKKIKK